MSPESFTCLAGLACFVSCTSSASPTSLISPTSSSWHVSSTSLVLPTLRASPVSLHFATSITYSASFVCSSFLTFLATLADPLICVFRVPRVLHVFRVFLIASCVFHSLRVPFVLRLLLLHLHLLPHKCVPHRLRHRMVCVACIERVSSAACVATIACENRGTRQVALFYCRHYLRSRNTQFTKYNPIQPFYTIEISGGHCS